MRTVLHVGCGPKGMPLPPEFGAYKEIRLDCDPTVEPDILASIVAMPQVPDSSHDAVYASHILEHLYAHEVHGALRELLRVVKPGCRVTVRSPDLQSVAGRIAADEPERPVYQSGLGPVTPMDMFFGMRSMTAAGNVFMAHRTGFTKSIIDKAMHLAGFVNITVDRDTSPWELIVKGRKPETPNASEVPSPTSVSEHEVRT